MTQALKLASVILVVLVLIIAYALTRERAEKQVLSDVITRAAPEYGDRAHVLLPNLRDALVIVPDRPHDPRELHSKQKVKMLRRRQFLVSTNQYGMRGPDFELEPSGTRILCLGDSVTFGWGVTYEQSYPALLAQKLGVEVINAGVPGMKPHMMGPHGQKLAVKLKPDLILFAARPYLMHPHPYQSYKEAIDRIQRAAPATRIAVLLPPLSTFDGHAHDPNNKELLELKKVLGDTPILDLTKAFRENTPKKGVTMIFQNGVSYMVQWPERKVLVEVKTGRPRLPKEFTAKFEADPEGEVIKEPLFFDGGHPDAEGLVIFAKTVATWIQSEQLLVPQPSTHDEPKKIPVGTDHL